MLYLECIVNNSGDSTLKSYSYSEGVLTIVLELFEIDKSVLLSIKTDCLEFNKFYFLQGNEMHRTCFIEIKELKDVLEIENGIYVPSKIFGRLMQECRANFNLAYGKRVAGLKYIFSLVGSARLVSCILSDLADIEIEEKIDR